MITSDPVHTSLCLPATPQFNSADRQIKCVSMQSGCVSGSGGVGGCWRCVKLKLINLVFISWHCLCLPRSHALTERHTRANNYPAMLQTAPQAKCTRRVLGADQEAKWRLITSFTSVFTNSPAWPLQATVSIDHMRTSCHTSETQICPGVFGMPARILLPDGALPACVGEWQGDGKAKGQNDITGVSQCSNSKGVELSGIQKLYDL